VTWFRRMREGLCIISLKIMDGKAGCTLFQDAPRRVGYSSHSLLSEPDLISFPIHWTSAFPGTRPDLTLVDNCLRD